MGVVNQNSANEVINDVKSEITKIETRMKISNLGAEVFSELQKSRDELQSLVSGLLLKKNIMTADDYDNAYETLRLQRKKVLEIDFTKSKILGKIVLVAGVLALCYLIYKKIKS